MSCMAPEVLPGGKRPAFATALNACVCIGYAVSALNSKDFLSIRLLNSDRVCAFCCTLFVLPQRRNRPQIRKTIICDIKRTANPLTFEFLIFMLSQLLYRTYRRIRYLIKARRSLFCNRFVSPLSLRYHKGF